jgi:hypothetical protein
MNLKLQNPFPLSAVATKLGIGILFWLGVKRDEDPSSNPIIILYQFNSSILRQGHSISTNKRTDLTQFHQSDSPHSDRRKDFTTKFLKMHHIPKNINWSKRLRCPIDTERQKFRWQNKRRKIVPVA